MGLNREVGERPARSRHCNEEQLHKMPLGYSLGRLGVSNESEPGQLPVRTIFA